MQSRINPEDAISPAKGEPVNRPVAGLLFAIVVVSPLMARVPEQARASIDRLIGGKGAYIADEGVYKVDFPREHTIVLVNRGRLSPRLGLNSWAAFAADMHHEAMLKGQFALLEDEVNPVLTTALDSGLEGTATGFSGLLLPEGSNISPGPVDAVLSMRGSVASGVYRATIGRKALLQGETIAREMGISSWIAFVGTNDRAIADGEFVAPADELQSVGTISPASGARI
jgi:Domain of Unknown Function (DUF1259)